VRPWRANHPEHVFVLWDNGPAHRGEPRRNLLATPDVALPLVSWPGYSPDGTADEAIRDWAREEVTGNVCRGTKARGEEKMGQFLERLARRADEVRRRCRTVLQAQADALITPDARGDRQPTHV